MMLEDYIETLGECNGHVCIASPVIVASKFEQERLSEALSTRFNMTDKEPSQRGYPRIMALATDITTFEAERFFEMLDDVDVERRIQTGRSRPGHSSRRRSEVDLFGLIYLGRATPL